VTAPTSRVGHRRVGLKPGPDLPNTVRGALKRPGAPYVKLEILIKMVGLLPRDPAAAVNVRDLRDRFYAGDAATGIKLSSELTNLRRALNEMERLGLVKALPALAGMERLPRYHLVEHKLYSYFMHSQVALGVHWSQRLLAPLGPVAGEADLATMAAQARLSRREQTLRDHVRVVPDGIGRAFASVSDEHLRTAVEALEAGRMIHVEYTKSDGSTVEAELSVLGLAQKDGSIYLIATRSMGGDPVHYAMHRLRSLSLLHRRPADLRSGFNIDAYIESQHQLAHVRHDRPIPVRLELLVQDCALFHFRERPLPGQEPIVPAAREGWHRVTATVRHTVMLVPFLWSHAPYVEVVGPASVRAEVADGIRKAAALYGSTVPTCEAQEGKVTATAERGER